MAWDGQDAVFARPGPGLNFPSTLILAIKANESFNYKDDRVLGLQFSYLVINIGIYLAPILDL